MSEFRLGKYKIIRQLAHGGMATIFLGEDTESGQQVAVKQILPHIAKDEEFTKRFIHETKVMMRLNHPNVLPILDAELGPEQYYIVMPLIDKGTLKDMLVRSKKIPADFSVFIINEVLKALDYAHTKNIIHRDLKPSNIMFDSEGRVYLADFGVARVSDMTQLTQTGEVLGTPGYMSPEQALGIDLTPGSDLFSIGIIFYELLTGYNPFQTDNPVVTMKQVVESHPPALLDIDPSIPPMLEPIILNLMKKKADDRYKSAIEVMEDLMNYWSDRDISEIKTKFHAFIIDPKGTHSDLMAREAKQRFQRAGEMWLNPDMRPRALWEAYQAIRLDPTYEEAKVAVDRWRRLLGAGTTEDDDPRTKKLEEKWRQEPENVQVLLQLGKLYRMRKDYINLMKVYQRLEQLNPQDPYTVNQMNTLLQRPEKDKKPMEAILQEKSKSFLHSIPWWAYLVVLAAILVLFVGGFIESEQDRTANTEGMKQQDTLFDLLGPEEGGGAIQEGKGIASDCESLERSGDYERALKCYEEVISRKKGHAQFIQLHLQAGKVAVDLRRYDDAAGYLNFAYANLPPPARWKAGVYFARALDGAGREARAEEIWDQVIRNGGESFAPVALLDRAKYYIRKSMNRTAKHDLEAIIEEYPRALQVDEARELLENL